ncbi:hypothetical protein [Nakamurella sp.]|uniref:hypothetical protein n=1 Tax=Nakamurella sp. TaxID=1869182 RepID=UPI0037850171
MTTHSDDLDDRADRHSRLDQLEREIAAERERLHRADAGNSPADERLRDERPTDARVTDRRMVDERPTDEQVTDRHVSVGSHSDRQVRDERGADVRHGQPTEADHRTESVRTVDLPQLEERVTESQREAWALGYQAGVADSQTRTGSPTQNPFHPLRGF